MSADTNVTGDKPRRGLLGFIQRLRSRLRRIFGKSDDPNIYPFF